jgi:putative ABC transport system permease protein
MSSIWLTLYRSLTRHRLYAILNIGGLALGIAVFLVLFLFVRFETGYDRWLPGWERVWVVKRTMQFPASPEVAIPSSPAALGQIKADWTDVAGARMLTVDMPVQDGSTVAVEHVARVDPSFFTLFPFPAVAGNPAAALARPDGVVVTQRVADSYLGKGAPLGRTLTLIIAGKPTPFRVGGVIAAPPASVYNNAIFIGLPPIDPAGRVEGMLTTFVQFPDAQAAARHVGDFAALMRRHPDPSFAGMRPDVLRQSLVPLASLHLANPHDRVVVATLALVGMLALVVAMVNYVNLATARAGLRAREVALRKVVGATRRALVGQFVGEAMATAAMAGLAGLALAELALPLVNVAGGTALAVTYAGRDSILPVLALLIGVTGSLSGLYPALALSGFQPAAVLASVRAPGGQRAGAMLRRLMVVAQFGIATALMIGTAVLVAQIRHLQRADLGFDRDGLVTVQSFADGTLDDSQRQAFAAAVAQMPGVVATTRAAVAPTGGSFWIGPMHRDGAAGPDPMIVRGDVGPGFFPTYGARLLAGRFLDARLHPGDDSTRTVQGTKTVVLNRTAVRLLGFADPHAVVGRTLNDGHDRTVTVAGVIDDLRFKSPRDPVEPQAYYERDRELAIPVLAVRHRGDSERLLDAMERAWRGIAPAVPFAALPVERQMYEAYYRDDDQRSRLFMIGAVLAVVIGCIGLYGLAAFDTARRGKEIGIRKVLGASTGELLRLLIGQFLKPVLLGNVVAVPLAYLAMSRWLAGFDDRVVMSVSLFVGAMVLTTGIAAATILGQAWLLARSEPWRALRYE